MSQSATANYKNAMDTLLNARYQNWASTEEMLNHFAWGFRNWLKGEMDQASHLDEILTKLKKVEEKLDRLDRSRGFSR